MTPEEVLQFVVVGAIVVIPALAISRIALRPMVDAVARQAPGRLELPRPRHRIT